MLRIANDLVRLGHQVSIFTGEWRGDAPASGITHTVLPTRGWLNHQRHRNLIAAMQETLAQQHFDYVVGFNRMPNLDAYYAADPCFIARAKAMRGFWYRFTPRYQFFADSEKAVFGTQSPTQILLLTQRDQAVFQAHYATPDARFYLLPPNIPLAKFAHLATQDCRDYVRKAFHLPSQANVILTVGSAYIRKGVDRAMLGLASLPSALRDNTWLLAIGELESASSFKQDAQKLGIAERCIEAGGRDDTPQLIRGADVLAHPARSELAGIVLLEALVAELPVIVTEVCGYASHIAAAKVGAVLNEPFEQDEFNQTLLHLLQTENAQLKQNAATYVQALSQKASPQAEADVLITLASQKNQQND